MMTKFYKSKYTWIVVIILIPLTLLGMYLFYLKIGKESEAALRSFCSEHGGYFNYDLVDGDFWAHLENTHLSKTDMAFLQKNWNRLVSHDLGDPGVIHLYLSHSTFEGDFVEILDDRVIGLTLTGLPINDATVAKIVTKCPNIRTLELNETKITDASIETMKKVPLGMLDIRDTNITYAGLRKLVEYSHLYGVRISKSKFSEQEMKNLQKILGSKILGGEAIHPVLPRENKDNLQPKTKQ